MFVLYFVVFCEEFVFLVYGRRMGEDFRYGYFVRFICLYGYVRIGFFIVRCNDGNWSNFILVCKGLIKLFLLWSFEIISIKINDD